MARYLIRGPHGALASVEVPSPALDQRTFDARLASGDYTIVEDVDDSPNVSDTKAVWVEYADSLGIDTAEMTKDEVIEAVEARQG